MEKKSCDLTSSLILNDAKINKVTPIPEKAHSLPDSESGLCWICLDETKHEPLLNDLCLCTHRQAHKSCLEKWYHYSRERQKGLPANCPACKRTYQNVDLKISPPPENTATTEQIVLRGGFCSPPPLFQKHISLPWQIMILFLGFTYGVVCKIFAHEESDLEIYIAVVFNCVIGFTWLFASAYRSLTPLTQQTIHSDMILLGLAYLNFLLGCAAATWAGLAHNPKRDNAVDLIVHAINFFCWLIFIGELYSVLFCKSNIGIA